MNREEAKLILQASRPGDAAGADPQLAEALALLKFSPELAAWYAEEQRWDASVRRELKTVPVPADLKARLLARQKAAESVKVVESPVAKEPIFTFVRSPMVWAMAAMAVIFLGLTFSWMRPRPAGTLTAFAHEMMAASPDDSHHLDLLNSDLGQVRGWLADRQGVADIELPPPIKNAPGLMGCRMMDWHGRPVSMLCFMMNGSQHVDLFMTPAEGIADAPSPGQPRFATVDQRMTAGWTTGRYVYLMAGQVSEGFMRHCLDGSASAEVKPSISLAAASLDP